MNLLITRNSEIYREIRLLRPAIGAIIRGDVKPLLAYFRYLTLRNRVKDKDVGILILAFYFGGYNISDQLLRLLLNGKPLIFESYDKCKFVITLPADFINIGLFYHELETFKFIMKQIKNCKVFVDVGANIGGYAIRAAKYCKVYAIEPLPRNYKILKINEKLNDVKIISFNIAAGNKNGKVKLYYTPGNLGLSTIKYVRNYFVEVEMKPLDEIINEESIDLMKIDVEGAEDLVLEGARNCLKRTKMVIIERSESFPKAYKILKEESFKFRKFLDHNVLFTK
jgi:FkbM family methyltransferase